MTKEKFFDKELADKVGEGKALHAAVLTQETRESLERINVERALVGLGAVQDPMDALLDFDKILGLPGDPTK